MTRRLLAAAALTLVTVAIPMSSPGVESVVVSAQARVLRMETADPTPVPTLWDLWNHVPADGPAFARAVAYADTLQGSWSAVLDAGGLRCHVDWPDHMPDNVLWGTISFEADVSVVLETDRAYEFAANRVVDGVTTLELVAVVLLAADGTSHVLLAADGGPDTGRLTLPAGVFTLQATFHVAEVNGHHALGGDLAVTWSAEGVPVRPACWGALKARYRSWPKTP